MISSKVKERFPSLFFDRSVLDRFTNLPELSLESRLLKSISPRKVQKKDPNHEIVSTNKIKDKSTGAAVEITEVTLPPMPVEKNKIKANTPMHEAFTKQIKKVAGVIETLGMSFGNLNNAMSSSPIVSIGHVLKEMGFVVPKKPSLFVANDQSTAPLLLCPLPLIPNIFGKKKGKLKDIPGCKSYLMDKETWKLKRIKGNNAPENK